jgi:Protein of unknown function (DUF2815)
MAVRTPIGLLSYPHLFVARPAAPGADPRFSCALLFDQNAQKDPAFLELRKAVGAVIDEFFGAGKSRDREFTASIRSPFRRTAQKKAKGYADMEGGIYIQPWSKDRPGVVDARLQTITVPGDVWPGQMARATVRPFAYDVSGNKGVNFNLNNIQICRTDGPRLDDRRKAEDEFDPYGDTDAGPLDDEDDAPFMAGWRVYA